jgi:hypothetical protein
MRVTFDVAKRQISIEGDAPELLDVLKIVREIAPKLPQISIATQTEPATTVQIMQPEEGQSQIGIGHQRQITNGNGNTLSMREWVRRLPLGNHSERIAAIGYYATKIEGRGAFSPREMSEWFSHCGFQKPSQMSVAINDTGRKCGYIESVGHAAWKLTVSGENLIVGKKEVGH